MSQVLSPKEISDRMISLTFSEQEETRDFKHEDGQVLVTAGRLPSNRPARIRISHNGPIVKVGLLVPGGGGLSVNFALFADEATDERVERYLDYYLGLHEMAVVQFQQELDAEKAV